MRERYEQGFTRALGAKATSGRNASVAADDLLCQTYLAPLPVELMLRCQVWGTVGSATSSRAEMHRRGSGLVENAG